MTTGSALSHTWYQVLFLLWRAFNRAPLEKRERRESSLTVPCRPTPPLAALARSLSIVLSSSIGRVRLGIAKDSAMGMKSLYAHGMQHRHLSSNSILLTSDYRAKVTCAIGRLPLTHTFTAANPFLHWLGFRYRSKKRCGKKLKVLHSVDIAFETSLVHGSSKYSWCSKGRYSPATYSSVVCPVGFLSRITPHFCSPGPILLRTVSVHPLCHIVLLYLVKASSTNTSASVRSRVLAAIACSFIRPNAPPAFQTRACIQLKCTVRPVFRYWGSVSPSRLS